MNEGPASMNSERFAALAAAYGGRLHAWPQAERAAAAAFARTEEGAAILQRAGGLDALLSCYAVRAPAPALQARIVSDAMARSARRQRARLWWSGLGLAGVGLAGALAGTVVAAVVAPSAKPDTYVSGAGSTAFGDVASDTDAAEEDL